MSTVDRRPSTDQQTSPALWAPSPNLGEGRGFYSPPKVGGVLEEGGGLQIESDRCRPSTVDRPTDLTRPSGTLS